MVSTFLRDVRFGWRLLVRSPGFTFTAATLLAIGIASNALVFSAVDALLLRPLPVKNPENLVRLVEVHPNDFLTWDLPYRFCDDVAARATSLSAVLCQAEADMALTDGASTERVRVHLVSANFFSSLGVDAVLGRVLTGEDARAGSASAVLSYNFWRRRFAKDRGVLGRTMVLGGRSFTVIGVSAERFNGLTVDTSPDLRVPLAAGGPLLDTESAENPTGRNLFAQIFGRLRPGVTLERANREVDPQLEPAYDQEIDRIFPQARGAGSPGPVNRSKLRLESVSRGVSALRAPFTHGLEAAMAGVGLLLMMACANVAGLLLARSSMRAPEIGIRLALGAHPGRVVRQLLTEGVLLAVTGGAAGLLLTWLGAPLLARALPAVRDRGAVLQPKAVHIEIDWRVLGFAAAITLLTAVLFALSPALRAARADLAGALRGGGGTTRSHVARNVIVSAQVALCTLILMSAALLVETLNQMRTMDPGFDRDRVVTFTIDPSLRHYRPEQAREFSKALLEKAAAIPGVRDAALASRALMRGTGVKTTVAAAGARIKPADFLNASLNSVTPRYFATMGMEVLGGRDFTWFDSAHTTPEPVIVNQAFARRFFPGQDPIGRRFGSAGPGAVAGGANAIVGVVSDARYRSLREPIPATVYHPGGAGFDSEFILHVRTSGRPEALIAVVLKLVRSLDPGLPVLESHTLREEVNASLWQERLLASLAAAFGAMAALLASIGLYGALDYAVKSRHREIGLRIALGAHPSQIAGLLLRTAVLVIGSGTAAGLLAYAELASSLQRILFRVASWDPLSLAAVLVLLGAIAVLGFLPAALRAIRISPSAALRSE